LTETLNGAANGATTGAPKAAATPRIAMVDRKRHAGQRVRPIADWAFARDLNAVPLTAVEFAEAAREMPIGFVQAGKDADGKPLIVAMALLGLRERENLLVDADGRWNGHFVPATLRRYPFAYLRTQGSDQLSLVVDESYGGLGGDEGELMLSTDGEPTDYLQQIMRFLDRYEVEQRRTEMFCARLVALDLLRGAEIKGELPGGGPINASGFYMVDEEKLNKLPDDEVLSLQRSGMLALIYAHIISMGQVQALAQRVDARAKNATSPAAAAA